MKTAFVYAGQGSQRPGMGKDFYDKYPEYRTFIDGLSVGIDLKRLMHEGPMEELSKTENTQGCMAAHAAGVTMLLRSRGIEPDAVAGLSLGEYSALYAAGVFSAKELVETCVFRGEAMRKAAEGIPCQMSAVLGAEAALVEAACKEYTGEGFVTVANYNCPGQYVICGDTCAVEAVEQHLRGKGVKRFVRLSVSGPFHTPYMKPAGEALSRFFEGKTWNEPKLPVLSNVTGDFYPEQADIKEILVKQVQSGVHMEDALRRMIEAGVSTFVEIGPGNAISGFLKKTARALKADIKIVTIDTALDFEAFTE